MSEDNRRSWSWGLFTGLMFIGLGIGLILGEPRAGVLFGMGLGFILASFIKVEPGRIRFSPPASYFL